MTQMYWETTWGKVSCRQVRNGTKRSWFWYQENTVINWTWLIIAYNNLVDFGSKITNVTQCIDEV